MSNVWLRRGAEKPVTQDARPASEGAAATQGGGEGSDDDPRGSLSRSFGKPKDARKTTETAVARPTQINHSENETGGPAVGEELHPHRI